MEGKATKYVEKLGAVLLVAESTTYDTASILLVPKGQAYEIPFTTKPKDQSMVRLVDLIMYYNKLLEPALTRLHRQ
jgi:predicted S18 family serine protease